MENNFKIVDKLIKPLQWEPSIKRAQECRELVARAIKRGWIGKESNQGPTRIREKRKVLGY